MRTLHWLIVTQMALGLSCAADAPTSLDTARSGQSPRTSRDATTTVHGASDDDEEEEDFLAIDPVTAMQTGDAGRVVAARDAGTGGGITWRDAAPDTRPPPTCGESKIPIAPIIPEMLIVLDRSGSMRSTGFLGAPAVDRWAPSVSAVKTLTASFQRRVSFGLMTFPAEGTALCTPGAMQVPVQASSASMIAERLDRMQPGGGTPTGETLQRALAAFQAAGRSTSPRYVLLVTDGQPTCPFAGGSTLQPGLLAQDHDHTAAALDALTNAGIKTFVVGYDAQLDPQLARALGTFAQRGGTERYYPVQDEATLVSTFTRISSALVACNFTFDTRIDDPRFVAVAVDGRVLGLNDVNGFSVEGQTVTLRGSACALLQEQTPHEVSMTLQCIAQ